MSREVAEVVQQLRSGKGSLSGEDVSLLESDLREVEEVMGGSVLEEEALLGLMLRLRECATRLAEEQAAREEDACADISTRMKNVAGWEVASLVGMVGTHHVFLCTKSKNYLSLNGIDMYISSVDFLLDHQEARARSHAAALVRGLAKSMVAKHFTGSAKMPTSEMNSNLADDAYCPQELLYVYERLYSIIVSHVKEHLVTREAETRPVRLVSKSSTQEELELDDLSGWHNLETSYMAYRALVEGFGGRYINLLSRSPEAYDIFIGKAGRHLNRYVRQAACELIGIILQSFLSVSAAVASKVQLNLSQLSQLEEYEEASAEVEMGNHGLLFPVALFSRIISKCLEDNWCQVRLAATQTVGVLLRCIEHLYPTAEHSSPRVKYFESIWAMLAPRLCLNRHYSTDSVRNAAHHAWRHITLQCTQSELGGGGAVLAIPCVTRAVANFYMAMTKHKNHMVVEAACAAIAELASRVNPEAVVEYLPCLCTTLRSSLADTSWPIRDTAAISVGRFLRFNGPALAPGYFCNQSMKDDYSDKTENNMHEVVGDLLGMLFMCLREDPFRPVRESAAVGLVDICLSDDVALGCDVWWNIEVYIQDNILSLCRTSNQSSVSTTDASSDKQTSTQSKSQQSTMRKNVQFIPNKILESMMASKSGQKPPKAVSTIPQQCLSSSDVHNRWVYSTWQESPGDTSMMRSMKRKKRKEMLAQRVSAGWGCCLDCGAGDKGEVTPCEVSWSCLLLLRELQDTIARRAEEPDRSGDLSVDIMSLSRDPIVMEYSPARYEKLNTKMGAVHHLLWHNFKQLFKLLSIDDYKDCAKFHTFLYEQLTLYLDRWFPATNGQVSHLDVPVFQNITAPPHPFHHVDPKPSPVSAFDERGIPSRCSFVSKETNNWGKRRLELQEYLRDVIAEAHLLLWRDMKCMASPIVEKWCGILDNCFRHKIVKSSTDENAIKSSNIASGIELHSPQKDCALDICLNKICDIFGIAFLKEIISRSVATS